MLSFEEMVKQEEEILRQMHPTPADIPSCTSILDGFLRSYAPGQQIRSLYRYGNISGTSHGKWDDFMYCLSLKTYSLEERREKWIRRRAEWWAKRRMERSSEDVWDIRTEPAPKWTPEGMDAMREVFFASPPAASPPSSTSSPEAKKPNESRQ